MILIFNQYAFNGDIAHFIFTVIIGGKEMSGITFLASSKPFIIPDEIEEYNNLTNYENMEDWVSLWVNEVDTYEWKEFVEGIFTMPYIYESLVQIINYFYFILKIIWKKEMFWNLLIFQINTPTNITRKS